MIYRKLPPHPPKMLLRIVAAAGTGVLLGASACSSSSTMAGSVVNPSADGPGDSAMEFASDAVAPDEGVPDEGAPMVGLAIGTLPCPAPCVYTEDAGADAEDGSPADAGDAALTCGNGGVCGSLVMPPDAGHDASGDASTDASVFHGVVINPGH